MSELSKQEQILEKILLLVSMGKYGYAGKILKEYSGEEGTEIYRHFCESLIALDSLQIANALEHAHRQLEITPDLDMAHGILGVCLGRAGKHEEALECLSEAIRLDPAESIFLGFRAATYNSMKEYQFALSDAREGLKLDVEDRTCWLQKFYAEIKLRRHLFAEATFEAIMLIDPEWLEAKALFSCLKHRQGYKNEAKQIIEDLMRQDPANFTVRYYYTMHSKRIWILLSLILYPLPWIIFLIALIFAGPLELNIPDYIYHLWFFANIGLNLIYMHLMKRYLRRKIGIPLDYPGK